MRAIHRGALAAAGVVVGAGMFAGCSASTGGTPTPSGAQPSGAAGSSASGAPSSPAADATLAAIDPCSLVAPAEAAQVGAQGAGEVRDASAVGSTSECRWHGRTPEDYALTVAVDIRASQGIDELRPNGGQITDGKVGSRAARQLADGGGGCIVTLKVGPKSRVDITVSTVALGPPTEPCDIAGKVAGFVNPRLPPEQN